jgi:uncharacterized membrane protein
VVTVDLARIGRHLFTGHGAVARAFPDATMRAIEHAVGAAEKHHAGELQFAIEAALPLAALLHGTGARDRAIDWFARLRVWDTEHNSGVLIYLLLADRRIEIVADRGVHARVGDAGWRSICEDMQRELSAGRFEQGIVSGVRAIGAVLATHFPATRGPNPNELGDKPVVL